MSTGEVWGRVKEWWEKELGATDSATMLPSPAQPWSRCDLMAANEEQRLALSVMFRHCQDLIAAAAREGREPWMVETLPPLRLIVTGTAGTGKSFIMKAAAFVIERIFGGSRRVEGNCCQWQRRRGCERLHDLCSCWLAPRPSFSHFVRATGCETAGEIHRADSPFYRRDVPFKLSGSGRFRGASSRRSAGWQVRF